MSHVELSEFIEWVRSKMGSDRPLVEMVRNAIELRAGSRSMEFWAYLTLLKADSNLKRGVDITSGTIKCVRELAICLRKVGLTMEIASRWRPWDRWRPGADFVIVYGERLVTIPGVARNVLQHVVGARDVEAIADLTFGLREQLQIDCRIKLYPVSANLSSEEAAEKYKLLLRTHSHAGAILVLGSPVVNPFAEPIARDITGGKERNLPGKFHWGYGSGSTYLSEHGKARKKEGIFSNCDNELIYRIHDDEIHDSVQKGGKRSFGDCGMILMDCSEMPYKILTAGHGGCGTVGCVQSLISKPEEIAARLTQGTDHLFDIINVTREKPDDGDPGIDDLFVDKYKFVSPKPDDLCFAVQLRLV